MPQRNSNGFVLITGLLVLLMLTIIMLTAMRTAALEERMAGNLRNKNIAFQAAESALREAEGLFDIQALTFDWDGDSTPDPNPFHPFRLSGGPFQAVGESGGVCVNGMCGPADPPMSESIGSLSDSQVRTATTGIPGVAQPQYVIELIGIEPSTDSRRLYATFRITARAWGEDPNSRVQLQSTYRAHVLSFVH